MHCFNMKDHKRYYDPLHLHVYTSVFRTYGSLYSEHSVTRTRRPLDQTPAACCGGTRQTCTEKAESEQSLSATAKHIEAPWLELMVSYRRELALNICRLSARSNLEPNVPCCVSATVGLKHHSSEHNGTAKGLIIAPIICIITMFF